MKFYCRVSVVSVVISVVVFMWKLLVVTVKKLIVVF